MRIEGLSHTTKVSQSNTRSDSARAKKPASGDDVVELSQDAKEVSNLAAKITGAEETGMSPRIQEVRAKIDSGFFNSREGLEAVADAMQNADPITDVVSEIATVQTAKRQLEDVPEVRPEKVQEARDKIEQSFFFSREVEEQTAGNLLDEMI